ncbi:MAG: hypothetical protein U9N42_10100 [Campylobacterota bacterium]|nr:hypothetical protein [Campylobacterota bacterium]
MQELKVKFEKIISETPYSKLHVEQQIFLKEMFMKYAFSHQEFKQIIEMSCDFNMWNEVDINQIWKNFQNKKDVLRHIRSIHENLKSNPSYGNFESNSYSSDRKFTFIANEKKSISLGTCPVASPNTRCCNLLTLDVVESCGFDCSYCSIQSFYNENRIGIDVNLAKKLKELKLSRDIFYHIGTGQSSDSLMWGNKDGILDALFDFAREYPNVILEFKTKSSNISYFLENDVPKNILCTWSLNTPTIIKNEEHLSASLDDRLKSARALANKGVLVGFHFHPIVKYSGYLSEYADVYKKLTSMFRASEVVLVSLGTLTFIKPVIKKLRERNFKSKILQMPFVNANGKLSYPLGIKKEMFKHAYDNLKEWHNEVFFYMCMEDESLWLDVFGYEYKSNNQMEEMMKNSYMNKIKISST